jgi:hypothetical protein
MLFRDAPLSDKRIGQYISAKIATKKRTLSKMPRTLHGLTAPMSISDSGIPGVDVHEVRPIGQDDEMTSAIKLGIYEGFYQDLTILDEKAGALSQVIAIITAFIVYIVDSANGAVPPLVASSFFAALAALVLTVSVLTVRWSTIEQMEDRTLEIMLRNICRVRNWRTIRLRVALNLSFVALALVSVHIVTERIN